ncbi:MAG: hypothetical protein ABWW70_04555 [Thermoproteota archaeon]
MVRRVRRPGPARGALRYVYLAEVVAHILLLLAKIALLVLRLSLGLSIRKLRWRIAFRVYTAKLPRKLRRELVKSYDMMLKQVSVMRILRRLRKQLQRGAR